MNARALVLAATISGIIVGMLSAFPIVYVLNFLFYAWIWIGALAAVYLYRHWSSTVKASQGSVVGLCMGLVAAPVTIITSMILGKSMVGDSGCLMFLGSAVTIVYVLPFPLVGIVAGALAGVLFERQKALLT